MATRPNILFVTIDSLRSDHIYESIARTPAHDSLMKEGVVYERAFSQGPFTTFSMPSLFTSRYPSGLEYLEFSESTTGVYIDDEPTIQEQLHELGYNTAGFHSNPLLSNLFGFDKGFDEFNASLPFSNRDRLSGRAKILSDKLFRAFRKHAYLPAEKLNKRAVEWLDSRRSERPFFLWLHYMDVHGPYQAKSGNAYLNKYRGERLWRKALKRETEITDEEHEQLKGLYRAEVEYTDRCLKDLFEALQDRGVFEETLIVLTSDHGEQFHEHGNYSHPHQLYDELTHVPLIVRDPETSPAQVDEITELIDVAPSLLKRAGGDIPESFTGRPLSEETPSDRGAISEADITPAYNGSIRTDRWRYIQDDTVPEELLFDIKNDPDQKENVLEQFPEIGEQLAARLSDHVSSPGRSVGQYRDVTRKDIDNEDAENRLKNLGYLD